MQVISLPIGKTGRSILFNIIIRHVCLHNLRASAFANCTACLSIWLSRFLRLVIDNRSLPRTATLAYYKSADLGECAMRSGQQGSIQLADATIIRCEYSMKDSTTIAPRLWGFKITTPEGKVYPFRAESAADREEWLLKLQEAAAACK